MIVADYDADGATACAVGVRGLAAMGADVEFLVPNRFEYGYGLTPEIVGAAAAMAPRLIVTVDNGIASHDGVAAAAALGIEVLITDHHLPAATLPAPALIVNPNQPGCAFPGKHLAGVGVMFYVLLATRAVLRARGAFAGRDGAESRRAARPGRARHGGRRRAPRPDQPDAGRAGARAHPRRSRATRASQALLAAAGRDPRRATSYDLGFVAGPRLNAAGRLADMALGIRCLLADSDATAMPLAAELDRLNRERRDVEATMQEEALADARSPRRRRGRRRRVHALPLPPRLASGRRRHRRGAAQGPLPSPGHRVRPRQRRRARRARGARSPASTCATRSTSSAKRAPGLHREVRRPRVRGRADARRGRSAALRRDVRGDRAGAADARAISPGRSNPTAASRPASSTLELAQRRCAQRSGARAFPPRCSTTRFRVLAQRIVGGNHSKLALARGDGALRRDPVPPRRIRCRRSIRAAYRPEVNEWRGEASLQLVIEHWQPA